MPLATNRHTLAQLVFCKGCCCGRPDRGKPDLPVEKLKAVWKAEKLNRVVQLSISGCIGPCDLTNVTLVMLPGENVWLGNLAGEETYDRFIQWARDCAAAGAVVPLPAAFDAHRFDRFRPPTPAGESHSV